MLPWVSRSTFRLLQHNYDQLHQLVREHADARYDALLEKYHALKLAGATSPEPVVPYTPRESDPYDELKALIADQAGTDLRRRGMMLRQLNKDRQDGISTEEIRQRIETGVVPDGVPYDNLRPGLDTLNRY